MVLRGMSLTSTACKSGLEIELHWSVGTSVLTMLRGGLQRRLEALGSGVGGSAI